MLDFAIILILLGVLGFWWNSFAARETARQACLRQCAAHGLQFLDDSVALSRLRLQRNPLGRMVIYREYRFEFSEDGVGRFPGRVTLLGQQVLHVDMLLEG
ncbi:MAG: DUF3301 domain-containing protein [Proteobacteria bacterium]|jgi:hypothetical protein|nr:DUF3301 domain-containing protein [Pseudomonadota bacterium]MCG6935638.1 DUF3301 domain-containing protein [Pseudomonadota bacterium]